MASLFDDVATPVSDTRGERRGRNSGPLVVTFSSSVV